MSEPIPQLEALQCYLAMVAGREPETSYFEIRARRATGSGMSQDFVRLRELDRAARSLVNRGQRTDAYVGVAPRAQRNGGLVAVERVWTLWVDCDGRDALRQLAAFRPLPSLVIRSGSDDHAHAYWPLRAPTPPTWAKRANQRLALALGADRNATDAARIMRAPATWNHKHQSRRPVRCTRLEPVTFELADVVGRLPDDPSYTRARREPPRAPVACGNVLDGLVQTVRDAAVGNRNAATFWAACRIAEHDLDADHAADRLREAALATGLGEREIEQTIASALRTSAVAA